MSLLYITDIRELMLLQSMETGAICKKLHIQPIVNEYCHCRYLQRAVACKQRGQDEDDAPISPPNPFQSLFGAY